jgi:hypothetical protein
MVVEVVVPAGSSGWPENNLVGGVGCGVSRASSNVPVPVMVPIQITTMGPLVVL